MQSLTNLEPSVRLSFVNPKSDSHSEFGPGIAELCRGVKNVGSLNAAAKNMHMAYSKAWRIVKETEASLGVILLNRDGAHGSSLTPEANMLLEAYDKICDATEENTKEIFSKLVER